MVGSHTTQETSPFVYDRFWALVLPLGPSTGRQSNLRARCLGCDRTTFDSMIGGFNPTSTYYIWAAEKALTVSEDDGLGGAVYADAFGDRDGTRISRGAPIILALRTHCFNGKTPTVLGEANADIPADGRSCPATPSLSLP